MSYFRLQTKASSAAER